MHATILALSTILASTMAAPTAPLTKRFAEGTKWIVTDLEYFHANDPSVTGPSYVTFSFSDPSPGIELNTTCTLNPFDNDDASDVYNIYHPCDDYSVIEGTSTGFGVSFRFDGQDLALNRTYDDGTIDPPYYQLASSKGQMKINSATGNPPNDGDNGFHVKVDYLEVPISSTV